MIARVALQIGVLLLALTSILVGLGLIVASFVAWLVPLTGLAGALAIAGAGFVVVALLLALLLGALAAAERRRRKRRDALVRLAERFLVLVPRQNLQRIEAGIVAALGLAALVALLLHPADGRKDMSG